MPGTPQPLAQPVANTTLDGSGNGSAQLGPTRPREHWQITSASVKTNQPPAGSGQAGAIVNDAICYLYVGSSINTATFVSKTITGSSGDTCPLAGIDIQSGMYVWVQWEMGDAGASATLTLLGTYTFGPPV